MLGKFKLEIKKKEISNFAYKKNYNIKLINENYFNKKKKKAHLNFQS